ncbi:MAG TPA: homocysteine S-methyltransferase family protein [Spirochaetota bacterium]|nr:homocysteine S-methyltransferase family protein [Spirochaetota bacterium]HOK93631.1 homocysteine S-methyltransferase family protein [Spirochaetota bacterium]HPP95597.1 homocysteine S-methyltransferase family protein [Spirochaetota bacterium]
MTKNDFLKLISSKIVILDGATGTELVKRGMPAGVCPELWCMENPAAIQDVQRSYINAGSDIIYAPTFGANRCKLEEFGLGHRVYEINKTLALLSKECAKDSFVFGDLAPTGRFIEPFGELPFEEAVSVYKEQVSALIDGGVDGFVIETMMDIQEARAALIAVKESCDLPVMVTMTFEKDGRTLNGTDPVSALITLQFLGADAVGCNCSTGPADMLSVIREMNNVARVPLLAKPNAGMPKLKDGVTVFDMGAVEFASYADDFIKAGANILGGCCGTTPDHIFELAKKLKGKIGHGKSKMGLSALSSARKSVFIGGGRPLSVVGERINPTGKKALQGELREGKLSIVQEFALEQENHGAAILDVNMGLSGIDEKEMMLKSVKVLAKMSSLPLCIDSTNPEVVEAALRIYPGRALVNSISGERDRIERMLPVAAKYGAMFILLPLDDRGIPETVDERKRIVNYVISESSKYGYTTEDIVVDGLVMTVSSDIKAPARTLDLIEWCSRERGVNTICGLSNVSFGLPAREWINSSFLAMAISRGLTMAIANPASQQLMNTLYSCDALAGRDKNLTSYVNRFSGVTSESTSKAEELTPERAVFDAVLRGRDDLIEKTIQSALDAGISPQNIVDNSLIPAITLVGDKYDRKEYFLPQLIMSADTMRKGFAYLEPLLIREGEVETEGKIVIATVKGDIHDIGKNIVALMLRNYGFDVVDLGKDVPAEVILDKACEIKADIIALSALMTTTMTEMRTVIDLCRERKLQFKFMIGGAVVDQNYADEIGADGYSKDAMDAVKLAKALMNS